jgi:hypothetical protein
MPHETMPHETMPHETPMAAARRNDPPDEARVPEGLVPAGDRWAAPLRERAATAPSRELADLLRHLPTLSGPRPTRAWRETCLALVEAASAREVLADVLGRLAVERPMWEVTDIVPSMSVGRRQRHLVRPVDGELVRGLLWAAALTGGQEAVPHLDVLTARFAGLTAEVCGDVRLAGAVINALADIGGQEALDVLWRQRSRIRNRALRKQLETALRTAAEKLGITAEQLVERGVPAHGLAPDGSLEQVLGGHRVRLSIEDAVTVRLTFPRPDAGAGRTAPAALRNEHAAALARLKGLAKEVRGTLAAERDRLDRLMSQGREWPVDEWRRHYRDHPVTGVLTRGLIWEFRDAVTEGDDGPWRAVAPGAEPTGQPERVRLWHPIRATPDEIAAWRERLVAERLRQPFKQAFRETYRITPAEEATALYSNRFAAHIVDYDRLYALFRQRGWQANFLTGHEDGHDGEASAEFGGGHWRARFHHEVADDDRPDRRDRHGVEYAATDQVRFEERDGRRWCETPLAQVPPLVFSEAMRDVDLFVGVTSVAADQAWNDRGVDRFAPYRGTAGFGELTAHAEVRREALERILPRLRIAGRCAVEGRFLVVRGDLTTYRIHLGSANVLMGPGDTYLCVVPARKAGTASVFLPFEDERLSLILSKAFLLAADSRITDRSILRQIKGAL